MAGLYESGEDYLEAILRIQKENENHICRSVDVARKLNVSKPSVSRAVGILCDEGYITVGSIGALEFTPKGLKVAQDIYHRHILLTEFLVRITGVSLEKAEENACRIEHDIDDEIRIGIENWMKKNGN